MKKNILIFIVLTLFYSCIKRFEKPSWETDVLSPILSTSLSIFDIVTDTSLKSRNDSIMVIFNRNLTPFSVDTLLNLNVKPFIRNVKLDSIKLNDQIINQSVQLKDLMLSLSIPDSSIYSFPLSIPYTQTDTIDASQYFQTVNLKEGYLDIFVNNNLPLQINNIRYLIKNLSSGDTVYYGVMGNLAPGASYSNTVNLAGQNVEGMLTFRYSFIIPPFSNVLLRYHHSLKMNATLRDMKINSALAVFPAQTIIDHKEVVYLEDMDDKEITEAIIDSGNLRVRVVSTIEQETFFTYRIPNALHLGMPFVENMTVPAAPSGGSITQEFIYPFNNFHFNFTGQFGDTVNAFYNELVGRLDSTGNQVFLTLEDSVDVIVEVIDLKPRYAKGYLGKQSFQIGNETIKFDEFNAFKIDSLSVSGTRISVVIENGLGMEGELKINNIKAKNTKTNRSVNLDISSLPDTIFVQKAVDVIPLVPKITKFQMNDNNSNISKLLSIFPNEFTYSIDVNTNPRGNNHLYNDFAYSSNLLNTFLNIEVPININAADFRLSDTASLSTNLKDLNKIKEGSLVLLVNNGFPIETDIELIFKDEWGTELTRLNNNLPIAAADIDNTTKRVVTPKESKIYFVISRDQMPAVINSAFVIVNVKFRTLPQGQYLQIYDYYNIQVKLIGDFVYFFNGLN